MSKESYEANDLGRKCCIMLNIGFQEEIFLKGDLFKLIKRDGLSRANWGHFHTGNEIKFDGIEVG